MCLHCFLNPVGTKKSFENIKISNIINKMYTEIKQFNLPPQNIEVRIPF